MAIDGNLFHGLWNKKAKQRPQCHLQVMSGVFTMYFTQTLHAGTLFGTVNVLLAFDIKVQKRLQLPLKVSVVFILI